jgi:hypothetical protein
MTCHIIFSVASEKTLTERAYPRLVPPDRKLTDARSLSERRSILRCRTAELAMTYAGPFAGATVRGVFWRDRFEWFDHVWAELGSDGRENTDLEFVESMREAELGRCWRSYHGRAWRLATDIVRAHSAQIGALAEALLQRDRLDGTEAFRICDSAGPAMHFGADGSGEG